MPSKDYKNQSSKRASKGVAQIQPNGGYLRIQLPRHLFGGQQKYLSLNLADTAQNRAKAQAKLSEIQRDIDYEEFDLTLKKYKKDYKIPESDNLASSVPTARELLKEYEDTYFVTRVRNRQSESYLHNYKLRFNKHLKQKIDVPFTSYVVDELIKGSEAGSSIRGLLIEVLRPLCKLAKLEYSFSGLAQGYKPETRVLPTDDEIEKAWSLTKEAKLQIFKDNAESWAWVFGVIATYGLRTHEVLAIDYKKSFKPANKYALYIDEKITDGTKTGSRVVYPLPIEWVELFDLSHPKLKVLEPFSKNIKFTLTRLSSCLNRMLRTKGVMFQMYDLRHRYAIRGHELLYSPNSMSKWMGHTLQMHLKVYQQYMQDDSHNKVYTEGLLRIEESKKIQAGRPSYSELEQQLTTVQQQLEIANLKIAYLEVEVQLRKTLNQK